MRGGRSWQVQQNWITCLLACFRVGAPPVSVAEAEARGVYGAPGRWSGRPPHGCSVTAAGALGDLSPERDLQALELGEAHVSLGDRGNPCLVQVSNVPDALEVSLRQSRPD